jgi:translation initiation factor IF-1
MGSDPAVRQFEGTVIEQLPSATYVVELPNRERVKAHMAAATKLNATRLRVKDKVLVEISPHDPTRGRIVKFLSGEGSS